MANPEHLDILKQGVAIWNRWRRKHPDILPDLGGADLREIDLNEANLSKANLSKADLSRTEVEVTSGKENTVLFRLSSIEPMKINLCGAYLYYTNLSWTDLSGTNFENADLHSANFSWSRLHQTNFVGAALSQANFFRAELTSADLRMTILDGTSFDYANLDGADLSEAVMNATSLGRVNLDLVKGLATVRHQGPSTISIDTIYLSQGDIPEAFLIGAGVPDSFITYARSLVGHPIDYYTCFIGYSSKDQAFAERLYADLQSKGVRCWFAPEDLKTGDKFWHRIDESIRLYDKLLVILSEHSIASTWVEHEVMAALEKERLQTKLVLFPIKLDETVMQTSLPWAASLRRERHIGDFTHWKNHDDYQKSFSRLLRDLKAASQ